MDQVAHKSHTQDRIRGVKGSKVLRTKKVTQGTDGKLEYSDEGNNKYVFLFL